MKKIVLYLILSLFISNCGVTSGMIISEPLEYVRKKGRDCCTTKNSLCKTVHMLIGFGFCKCNSALFCAQYTSGDGKMDDLFKNKE